jgi:hypothetical protein
MFNPPIDSSTPKYIFICEENKAKIKIQKIKTII